ncbi:MAG: septum site determining protein [Nocardioides sp.]|nr:septum site determining protein [Nocardioides sp.]
MTTPLLITRDQSLLDEVGRLAAAAGVTPEIAGDPGDALRSWTSASVVLVGADIGPGLVEVSPPRRAGVYVVGWGRLPDELFRVAVGLGAEHVAELPRSASWVLELLADAGEQQDRHGLTIAVTGGSGGAGATTFACALATIASRHGTSCLIDADPLGPGVDRVLGMDGVDGVRWDALEQTSGRMGARSLSEALPRRNGMGILTWPAASAGTLQAFAAREALSAAARGHDAVVLDLPRTGGELVEELMARCQHLLVVVRATVPGVAAATRFVTHARATGPVSLVVRGNGVDAAEVARLVGAPVVAAMTDQRGLDEAVDLGSGPVRSRRSVLARASGEALQRLRGATADRPAA